MDPHLVCPGECRPLREGGRSGSGDPAGTLYGNTVAPHPQVFVPGRGRVASQLGHWMSSSDVVLVTVFVTVLELVNRLSNSPKNSLLSPIRLSR